MVRNDKKPNIFDFYVLSEHSSGRTEEYLQVKMADSFAKTPTWHLSLKVRRVMSSTEVWWTVLS